MRVGVETGESEGRTRERGKIVSGRSERERGERGTARARRERERARRERPSSDRSS